MQTPGVRLRPVDCRKHLEGLKQGMPRFAFGHMSLLQGRGQLEVGDGRGRASGWGAIVRYSSLMHGHGTENVYG